MRSDQHTSALAPALFPPPPQQAREEDGPRRKIHLLVSLRRHRRLSLAALICMLTLSAAMLYSRRGAWYEAKSFVYISPTFPATLSEDKEQDRPYDAYIQDQVQTVTRYDILAAAVEHLGPGYWRMPGEAVQAAVSRLQRQLDAERVGATFQISISLRARDPREAASVVNAVTNAFIGESHREEFYGRDQRLVTLRDERAQLQSELDQTLASQAKLMGALGVASIGQQDANPYDAQLTKLHADLAGAREQRMTAEAQLASVKAGGPGNTPALDAIAIEAAAGDSGLVSLKGALNQRRAVLIEQMNGLTSSNPLYQQDAREMASITAELSQSSSDLQSKTADRIERKLEAEVYRARMVEARLQQEVLAQTNTATAAAPKFQHARELGKNVERLEASYTAVDDRIRDLELESGSPGSVHLSSPALAPLTPVKSRTWMLALLLLSGSCLISAGLCIAIDLFDPRIYTVGDTQAVTGFPPIGVLLDHDDFSYEAVSQHLLKCAGAICHAKQSTDARIFLVTGLTPESGVTGITERLGRHLRSLNLKTLTVAAANMDGRVSYVATVGGSLRKQESGAPEVSAHFSNEASRLGKTAGIPLALHGNPTHPVSNASFISQILREVRDEYDIILIDSSPLLISADTEYLARVSDGTLLVVASGGATRDQLARAARLLERLRVPGVAIVLNRIRRYTVDPALARDIESFERELARHRSAASVPAHEAGPTSKEKHPAQTASKQPAWQTPETVGASAAAARV